MAVVALNDEIADGRDVSWIWDVDFEPLAAGLERLVATGGRAAELALRFAYGGLARDRIEVVPDLERALDRGLELTPAGGELVLLPTYTAMLALRAHRRRPRPHTELLGARRREDPRRAPVPGLPEHLRRPREHRRARARARRARARARRSTRLDRRRAARGAVDLFYVGGGQDREQALVAADLAGKAEALREAVADGAAFLAVCGGYQLLGRFYRDRAGVELPGIGLLPLETIAGERRMIGDVLLECEWAGRTLAGFENHAGRTLPRRGRRAARARRSPASATTASPATRAAAPAASTARTSTARSCRATLVRRPPARGRARARDGRRAASSRRSTTSSRQKRTPSPPQRARTRGGRV